jgi:hypothetical protein
MLKLFLLLFACVDARIDMLNSDMQELLDHPMEVQTVTDQELQSLITEDWMNLINAECDNLDPGQNLQAYFDGTLIDTNTLAWASYTVILMNGVWVPSISTLGYVGYDFLIGVNPEPPNGWYAGKNCSDIGYRYDLRTVLRHELLHGLGIGSSITKYGTDWRVGRNYNGNCYPQRFDLEIKDEYGQSVVEGCTVKKDLTYEKLYLNGVRLYNPVTFSQGSSISHHTYPDELMFYQLPPKKCIGYGENEAKMLAGVQIPCSNLHYSSPADRVRPWPFLILAMLLLFCF